MCDDVATGNCVVITLVEVGDVEEVDIVVSETCRFAVDILEVLDDKVSVVGAWDKVDDDVPWVWLLEAAALLASPVTLTTNIAPNPEGRVKFCKQHSCHG